MPAEIDPGLAALWLTLDFRTRSGAAGLGADGYDVTATNSEGVRVLEIHLPVDLVERVVASHLGASVAMSPEGLVSVQMDEFDDLRPHSNELFIDKLVAQAIEPSMLEDETEVRNMLTTLRERLRRAIELVDVAIARIADQS